MFICFCSLSAEADLFRADVEQAIGASSAVQDRLIVVRLDRDGPGWIWEVVSYKNVFNILLK